MSRLKYFIPPLIGMAAIFVFSTSTFSARATGLVFAKVFSLLGVAYTYHELAVINHIIRKAAHVVVYGILALLCMRAALHGGGYARKKALLIALLVTVAVAASDEAHQMYVPDRTPKVTDVALDSCAAALALLTVGKKRKKKAPS